MYMLQGKVVVVTGSGRGIGRSMTEVFAARGATVVGTSRAAADGYPDNVTFEQLDVGIAADWARVIGNVVDRHGRVDVLVNNAGIIKYEPTHELEEISWNEVVRVNQTGTWLGMREVIPHMIKSGSGSIINVSSIWGNVGIPGAVAYHATKGAVRTMTKNAAVTHAKDNIRVNSLHPGFTVTPLTDAQDPAVNEWVIGQTPIGRAGRPEEIANAAVFLGSDDSSFVTGAELVVDGGYLAQ